jgi:hypothetical protein
MQPVLASAVRAVGVMDGRCRGFRCRCLAYLNRTEVDMDVDVNMLPSRDRLTLLLL